MSRRRVRPDLAVVLCTYNGERYVEEQVRSILAQRMLPGEIRVYDDGSSDRTLELARHAWEQRAADAAGVGLFVASPGAERFGAAANFARALSDTAHPIVALCDQDDVWSPDRLAATVGVLDAEPAVEVVGSDAALTDGGGRPVGRTVFEVQRLTRHERAQFEEHDYLPALLRRNVVPGMTITLRRDLLVRLGPVPPGAIHDYWLVAAAAARGTLRIVVRPLVRYRIHGANVVGLDIGRSGRLDRIRAKLRVMRRPVPFLPQWQQLPLRLEVMGDEAAAARLHGKLAFERARRHVGSNGRRSMTALPRLLIGRDYLRYESKGRRAAVHDALRGPDPFMRASTGEEPHATGEV